MNRMWIWVIGLIIVAAAIVGVVAATHDNSSGSKATTSNTNTPASTPSSNTDSSNQSSTATDKVSISNMSFSPAKITVKKGTSVTWTNNDSTAHTVTSGVEHGPNSSDISPGSSFTFSFADDGTFDYHCSIHPQMTGTVTVTD